MKKNIFFLMAALVCLQATAQIPALVIIPLLPKKKVTIFKRYAMDSSYTLVGIQPAFYGTAFTETCFLVDNQEALQTIKKEWKVSQPVSTQPDSSVIRLFLLKDKKVVSTWTVFPQSKTIITNDDTYQFNLDRLKSVMDSYPLRYSKQVDTFYALPALKRFSDSISLLTAFIFTEPAHFSFEGSFVIQPVEKNTIAAEDIEQEIARVCKKNLDRDSYSIYKKPGSNPAEEATHVYLIKCSREGYEKFAAKEFIKAEWVPEPKILVSYWKAG